MQEGKVAAISRTALIVTVSVIVFAFPVSAGYIDNGNGTVSDTVTRLTWQKTDDGNRRTWKAGLAYCESLDLGGRTDWRLPNYRELQSLVDYTRYDPAIDPVFGCRSSDYWSGSTFAYDPDDAWYVNFDYGYVYYLSKYYTFYVRCVRAGPSGSFDPLPLLNTISGHVTDTAKQGISGISIYLNDEEDQVIATTKTGTDGSYQFSDVKPGYYRVTPCETDDACAYYPQYEVGGKVRGYREVTMMKGQNGVEDVNFTLDETPPFVKLLFPRSGDKLKGDFRLFGTAFKTIACTACQDVDTLVLVIDGFPKLFGTFYGNHSDRFSLSQVVWRDASGAPYTGSWEALLPSDRFVVLQAVARNASNQWTVSQRISVTAATTTNTASIVPKGFDLLLPACDQSRQFEAKIVGTGDLQGTTWYTFKMDYPDAPLTRVEYDAKESMSGVLNDQTYPVEDVYPVGLAAVDDDGNTLVKVVDVLAYRAARFGDPEGNTSGSRSAAFGVNVVSGNLYYQTGDMSLEGVGLPFVLARSYNSLGYAGNGRLGGGWSHSYDYRIFMDKSGRRLYLTMPDGHWERFALSDGAWRAMTPGAFGIVLENSDHTFTVIDKSRTRYDFAYKVSDWKLTKMSDTNGNALTFDHDEEGKLIKIVDTRGRAVGFEYTTIDKVGKRLQKVSDGTGRFVTYGYDEGGYLTSFVDRMGGKPWTYKYEDFGTGKLLIKIIDPIGHELLTNTYKAGRVVSQKDARKNSWKIAYGKNLTTVTDPKSHTMQFYIAPFTRMVTRVVDSMGHEMKTSYKPLSDSLKIQEASLVSLARNPLDYATKATYAPTGSGNPTLIEEPLGRKTGMGYDEDRATNKNLITTLHLSGISEPYGFSYDALGNMNQLKNPLGKQTNLTYNARGQVTSVTDPRGHTTTNTYENGYLTGITDSLTNGRGQSVTYTTVNTYDSQGRLKTVKDRNGYIATTDYDANDRIVKVTDPLGNSIVNTYDEAGNLISARDRRQNETFFTYNEANLLVSKEEKAAGATYKTSYTYDELQRLKTVKNARGFDSSRFFDDAGRLSYTQNPVGETVHYEYDANGNVIRLAIKDDGGMVLKSVSKTYDALDRVEAETLEPGDGTKLVTTYAYEEKTGRLKSVTNPKGKKTEFTYDTLGRVKTVKDPAGKLTKADYDFNGNLIKVIDPEKHVTTYEYDALNRLIWKKDHKKRTWKYDYDGNSNLVYDLDPRVRATTYDYDAVGLLKAVTYYRDDGKSVAYSVSFSHDENGNLKAQSDPQGTAQYAYDELNRLIERTDCYKQKVSYGYDEVGNLTSLVYPGNKKVSYTFDHADRMESVTDWLSHVTRYKYNALGQIYSITHANKTSVNLGYDLAGRLTSYANKLPGGSALATYAMTLDKNGNRIGAKGVEPWKPPLSAQDSSFTYDELNRLISMTAGGAAIAFSYDVNGNLVKEASGNQSLLYGYDFDDRLTSLSDGKNKDQYIYTADGNRVASVRNGTKTRYVLDVNAKLPNVLAQTNDKGKVQEYFVYGASGLLSMITPSGDVYTYHFDPTGNTVALTDTGGKIVNRYAYTPYGRKAMAGDVSNPFTYSGQHGVMTEYNDLYFMRARFYHSDMKRFVSQDRVWGDLKEPQSLNLYAYVRGNPVMGIDPSGMEGYWDNLKQTMGSSAKELWKGFKFGQDVILNGVADNIVDAGQAINGKVMAHYAASMQYAGQWVGCKLSSGCKTKSYDYYVNEYRNNSKEHDTIIDTIQAGKNFYDALGNTKEIYSLLKGKQLSQIASFFKNNKSMETLKDVDESNLYSAIEYWRSGSNKLDLRSSKHLARRALSGRFESIRTIYNLFTKPNEIVDGLTNSKSIDNNKFYLIEKAKHAFPYFMLEMLDSNRR